MSKSIHQEAIFALGERGKDPFLETGFNPGCFVAPGTVGKPVSREPVWLSGRPLPLLSEGN